MKFVQKRGEIDPDGIYRRTYNYEQTGGTGHIGLSMCDRRELILCALFA